MEQEPIARQSQVALPPDKVVSRLAEWFRRMSESGLSIDDLQDPIDDPAMRNRLVTCWKSRAYIPTFSQLRARSIMGPKNFLGVEEVFSRLLVSSKRIWYTDEQLLRLAVIPWGESYLHERRHTHVLVAGYPVSITELCSEYDYYNACFRTHISTGPFYDGWQREEAFAKPKLDVRWYLLRKEAVPGTKGKSFSDQLSLLPSDEYLPSACEVLYAAYLYYAVRGMFLFQGSRTEGEDVRTRDEHFRGGRVTVGARYSHCNVYLGDYDDSARAAIGLAGSCRVPDTVAP